jgi:hypothetical protein
MAVTAVMCVWFGVLLLGPTGRRRSLSESTPHASRAEPIVKRASDAAAMRAGSGDAGGEEAEIVGTGAEGEVGDACAQDGDRFGR